MCGPHRRFAPLLPRTLRRIPQAVSTVATEVQKITIDGKALVSIPQAVSTVATNLYVGKSATIYDVVSIPQAVSTVATQPVPVTHEETTVGFNTASGKHCCNWMYRDWYNDNDTFQYRKR